VFTPGKLLEPSLDVVRPFYTRARPLDQQERQRRLGANVFWLDPENVVSSIATPETNKLLRSLGYQVHALDFSDLVAMWGGVRCVTCPLRRG
jgi:arginine deiminase